MVSFACQMPPNRPQFKHLQKQHFLSFLKFLTSDVQQYFDMPRRKTLEAYFCLVNHNCSGLLDLHHSLQSPIFLHCCPRNCLFSLSKYKFFQGSKWQRENSPIINGLSQACNLSTSFSTKVQPLEGLDILATICTEWSFFGVSLRQVTSAGLSEGLISHPTMGPPHELY